MSKTQAINPEISLARIPGFISDINGKYTARRSLSEEQIIKAAKALLKRRFYRGQTYTETKLVKAYLMAHYATFDHEVFGCLFLDSHLHILAHEELFRGTVDGASVYPREVVKRALHHNAVNVIFVHNHPSGSAEPSLNDKLITEKLKKAFEVMDINVLDHFVIGGSEQYSFSEHGLI